MTAIGTELPSGDVRNHGEYWRVSGLLGAVSTAAHDAERQGAPLACRIDLLISAIEPLFGPASFFA